MKSQLDDELAFLNEKPNANSAQVANATQPTQLTQNNGAVKDEEEEKYQHWKEKENAIRVIIENWEISAEAGTPVGKKAVADKESVLKSILHNWKI